MKTTLLSFLLICGCFTTLNGQHLLAKKLPGCKTDSFAVEALKESVPTDSLKLTSILYDVIGSDNILKSKGALFLQIIVDMEGNSCLISMDDRTNMAVSSSRLRKKINAELHWAKPKKNISTIIRVDFDNGISSVTRMGLEGSRGYHDLKKAE